MSITKGHQFSYKFVSMSKGLLFLALIYSIHLFGQGPQIGRTPDWVTPISPKLETTLEGVSSGYYYLLVDQQENLQTEQNYSHFVYKILSNEGLQEMANLSVDYDPAYENVIWHSLIIYRNGKGSDRIKKESVKTIQREQDMDRNLYDGSLTQVINLQDIRVGDVIEYSFTKNGYNPVYEKHYSRTLYFRYGVPFERQFNRIVAPAARLAIRYFNNAPEAIVAQAGKFQEYVWDVGRTEAMFDDRNTPSWYDPYPFAEVSAVNSWKSIIDWGVRQYRFDELKKIDFKAIAGEPWEQGNRDTLITRLIRFVQDDVRYLGFESGIHSHRPHAPAQVFEQRFGDCKDKSLLLVTLLRQLGIEAAPVLVNTNLRQEIVNRLPSINVFNHCVVTFKENGDHYFIDPTISSQGGQWRDVFFPNYGFGLVLSVDQDSLTRLPENKNSRIWEEQDIELTAVNQDALVTIRTTYEGVEADIQRSNIASSSLESIAKNYLTFYGNLYHGIESTDDINIEDDRERNRLIISEQYRVPQFWQKQEADSTTVYCELYALSMENLVNVDKLTSRESPYRLNHPTAYRTTIRLKLPEAWNITEDKEEINGDSYEYEYKVSYNKRTNLLTINHEYKTKADYVASNAIQKFVEDHKRIMGDLSYYLTYKLNSSNAKKPKWIVGLLLFMCLGFAALACWRIYTLYDPEPRFEGEGIQIGGWLFLIGIGVVITPFRLFYQIFFSDDFLDFAMWSSLIDAEQWNWIVLVFVEMLYNSFYLVYSILVLIIFIQRKTSFPRLMSLMLAVSATFLIADTLVAHHMGPGLSDEDLKANYKEIVRGILAALIWIPYLNIADRVKKTFVLQRKPSVTN